MSWDSYLDNLCAQSKGSDGSAHIDKCCIIGIDGGAKWTTDGHPNALTMADDECANIARTFKSKDFSPFMANGFKACGVKYQFLREEDGKLVIAKKKGEGAISMQASKTAIVVGHCPEGGQQGITNKGVAVIADYLESLGM